MCSLCQRAELTYSSRPRGRLQTCWAESWRGLLIPSSVALNIWVLSEAQLFHVRYVLSPSEPLSNHTGLSFLSNPPSRVPLLMITHSSWTSFHISLGELGSLLPWQPLDPSSPDYMDLYSGSHGNSGPFCMGSPPCGSWLICLHSSGVRLLTVSSSVDPRVLMTRSSSCSEEVMFTGRHAPFWTVWLKKVDCV